MITEPESVPSPVDGWIIDENAMGPEFLLDEVDTAWEFPDCPKRNELDSAELLAAAAYNFSYIDTGVDQNIVVRVPSTSPEIAPTITLGQYTRVVGGELTALDLLLFNEVDYLLGEYELLEAYRHTDNQKYLFVVYKPESSFQHDQ